MKQCVCVRSKSVPGTAVTGFTSMLCPMEAPGAESLSQSIWVTAGTFSNLIITLAVAPGVGKSWTFTVRKNGGDTSVTCTISGTATTARDTTNSFTVASGDLLALKLVPSGTPTSMGASGLAMSLEFDGTTSNESGHTWTPQLASAVAGRRNGLFAGAGTWTTNAGSTVASVAAVAGTIAALGLNLCSGAPGVGNAITVHIYKNGVKQDGTGGTVNTATTLTAAVTTAVQTFSLPCALGDVFYLETSVTGTPAGATLGVGVRFVATTNGESNQAGRSNSNNGALNPGFVAAVGGPSAWNVPEADVAVPATVSSFTLSHLQILLMTAPGTAKTWTFDLRRNAGSPGPSVALTGAATTGADNTNTAGYVDGDTMTLRGVPTSSPASDLMAWCCKQTDVFSAATGATFSYLMVSP